MTIIIPRSKFSRELNSKAHPYPFEIAMQTHEFIMATLFFGIMADTTSGEYVRQPNAINNLKIKMLDMGMSVDDYEKGWKYLIKYRPVFDKWLFQSTLIAMRSHWDWYIRHLGEFVIFARKHTKTTLKLSQKDQELLEKVGNQEITRQLEILEKACNLKFNISDKNKNLLKEVAYVRNLGIHNRWEVDERYSKNTLSAKNWQVGEIRTFEVDELNEWFGSLIIALNETSTDIAKQYYQVPDYN